MGKSRLKAWMLMVSDDNRPFQPWSGYAFFGSEAEAKGYRKRMSEPNYVKVVACTVTYDLFVH